MASVAVFATAPTARIKLFMQSVEKLYPDSGLFVVCQRGRGRELESHLAGWRIIEALPPGAIDYPGLFKIDYSAVRSLAPDLLFLPCNNPTGFGYGPLHSAVRRIGSFCLIGICVDHYLDAPRNPSALIINGHSPLIESAMSVCAFLVAIFFVVYVVADALIFHFFQDNR